jgi:GTP-binding protein HflX
MRGLELPSGRKVILSDTVGFISELPTELVAAFRATLEEVAEADIILHVRDAAHPDSVAQRGDVIAVLNGMVGEGALDAAWPERVIEVLNKADLLGGPDHVPSREGAEIISAITGEGLDRLRTAIDRHLLQAMEQAEIRLPVQDGAALSWLYAHGEVVSRTDGEDEIAVVVRLLPADRARFEREHQAHATPLIEPNSLR